VRRPPARCSSLLSRVMFNVGCGPQAVPLPALKLAIRSEHLQLASENDAYALANGWAASRPPHEEAAAFTELARCLRFHHMSLIFLASAVLWSKRRADCPFLAQACSSALAYKSLAGSVSKVPHHHEPEHPFLSSKPSRVQDDKKARYTWEVPLRLTDCLPLGLNEFLILRIGVAEGFEVCLNVRKDAGGNGVPALAVFVSLRCRDVRHDEGVESDTVGLSGPMAAIRLAAPDYTFSNTHLFKINRCYGAVRFFQKPWDEVVCKGSKYFPEGRMSLMVDIHLIRDKHL
jgi:hypothetical protein